MISQIIIWPLCVGIFFCPISKMPRLYSNAIGTFHFTATTIDKIAWITMVGFAHKMAPAGHRKPRARSIHCFRKSLLIFTVCLEGLAIGAVNSQAVHLVQTYWIPRKKKKFRLWKKIEKCWSKKRNALVHFYLITVAS